jgi:putative transposase
MPWRQTGPMDERLRFLYAYDSELYSVTELCERFGISRKTGYKWLARFAADGLPGMQERSRAPKTIPHKLASDVAAAIVAVRKLHPRWGPRKLLAWLATHRPELEGQLPAPSTAGALLHREGLIDPAARRRRPPHPGSRKLNATAPNEVWTADFKGQFLTKDGHWCYPLTVADAASRLLLGCVALPSVETTGAKAAFTQLFEQYGLPQAIRTDNGVPFATVAIAGLSQLNVWWIKLGITHQRIRPGRPTENGQHERMHRTLKAEATRPPEADRCAQQTRFDRFRAEYNDERPHEALDLKAPSSVYSPSARPFPPTLPEPEYAGHMQIRFVSNAGGFRFKTHQVYLCHALRHEYVALEEIADGIWSIYFYNVLIGRLNATTGRVVH